MKKIYYDKLDRHIKDLDEDILNEIEKLSKGHKKRALKCLVKKYIMNFKKCKYRLRTTDIETCIIHYRKLVEAYYKLKYILRSNNKNIRWRAKLFNGGKLPSIASMAKDKKVGEKESYDNIYAKISKELHIDNELYGFELKCRISEDMMYNLEVLTIKYKLELYDYLQIEKEWDFNIFQDHLFMIQGLNLDDRIFK